MLRGKKFAMGKYNNKELGGENKIFFVAK